MDSPIYSQDEFDLNLPFHHHQLKEKFHFLLEKSIASTKGSPLLTPDESVLDLKTNFGRKFKLEAKKKHGKKIDVLDSNTKLGDMVSSKAALVIPKLNQNVLRKKIEKKTEKKEKTGSATLRPPKHGKHSKMKWSEDETNLFYRSLEQYGTDFSIIAHLFKNRDRIQIKNKYLKEEKLNPNKIHFHLNNSKKKEAGLGKKIMRFNDMFMDHLITEKKNEMGDIPHFTVDEFKNDDHDHLDHKIHHHVCEIMRSEGENLKKKKQLHEFMKTCL